MRLSPLAGLSLLNFGIMASVLKLIPPINMFPSMEASRTTANRDNKGVINSAMAATSALPMVCGSNIPSRSNEKLTLQMASMARPNEGPTIMSPNTPDSKTTAVPISRDRGICPFSLA